VIIEVEACLDREDHDLGLLHLAAWFEGDGRGWLEMAGLDHLAELAPEELARRAFEFGPEALDKSRRCYNCGHLRGTDSGRVRCGLGLWKGRGWHEDYARATTNKEKFQGCGDFEQRRGNGRNDGRRDNHD
jgi:hypothetical protein